MGTIKNSGAEIEKVKKFFKRFGKLLDIIGLLGIVGGILLLALVVFGGSQGKYGYIDIAFIAGISSLFVFLGAKIGRYDFYSDRYLILSLLIAPTLLFSIIGIILFVILIIQGIRGFWKIYKLKKSGNYNLVFDHNIPDDKKKSLIQPVISQNNSIEKSEESENERIISAYNLLKRSVSDYDEPNYSLATKVFLEFNDFNLKNIDNGLMIYLGFIPKSLLPYPKNYIKCAYYIFLERLEKEKNTKMIRSVQEVGCHLFLDYPDYDKYKENLKKKKFVDDALKDANPREQFKKLYGVYEVSEEDYYSSPSSVDSTDEQLIHDFGFLPEIEKDVDMAEKMSNK